MANDVPEPHRDRVQIDLRPDPIGERCHRLVRVVARAVEAAVQQINPSLPSGVRLETFYDRTMLVDRTLKTVAKSLAEGGILVIVVLFLLLRNMRAGLITALMIPLCMLGAFIGMRQHSGLVRATRAAAHSRVD